MNPWLVNNRWVKEARDLPPDPVSGAKITRLSGSSIRTENIAPFPYASRDGKRFVTQRYVDHLLTPNAALMCHDLTTKWTTLIDRETEGVPIGPAWGGAVYYLRGTKLMRASLDTLATEPVLDLAPLPPCWQLMSVSADERYLIYTTMKPGPPEAYNVVRIDLRDRSWKLLLDQYEPSRCGAFFHPTAGHEMLIGKTFWEGNSRIGVSFLADADGRIRSEVMRNVHHACWLGNTGQHAGLVLFNYEPQIAHKPENPDGELYIFSTDGTPPRLVPVPEHVFYHISSSPCGRYVVCEALCGLAPGPVPIVVVNVETGKRRALVADAHCSAGGDAGRQVNPYFMADLKHVIYTADPDGVVNVFAAELPPGFLESLN